MCGASSFSEQQVVPWNPNFAERGFADDARPADMAVPMPTVSPWLVVGKVNVQTCGHSVECPEWSWQREQRSLWFWHFARGSWPAFKTTPGPGHQGRSVGLEGRSQRTQGFASLALRGGLVPWPVWVEDAR